METKQKQWRKPLRKLEYDNSTVSDRYDAMLDHDTCFAVAATVAATVASAVAATVAPTVAATVPKKKFVQSPTSAFSVPKKHFKKAIDSPKSVISDISILESETSMTSPIANDNFLEDNIDENTPGYDIIIKIKEQGQTVRDNEKAKYKKNQPQTSQPQTSQPPFLKMQNGQTLHPSNEQILDEKINNFFASKARFLKEYRGYEFIIKDINEQIKKLNDIKKIMEQEQKKREVNKRDPAV
jgi:ferritin